MEDERIRRIRYYEELLNEAADMLDADQTKENEECLGRILGELEDYYVSQEWKDDFVADEAGELPSDLNRGVLSEDGIYNMLQKYQEYICYNDN